MQKHAFNQNGSLDRNHIEAGAVLDLLRSRAAALAAVGAAGNRA